MIPKNAMELLFEFNFGNGPAFKNQIELVNELLNNPGSSFFTDKDADKERYDRETSRLKAYVSQLLSDSARRTVSPELHESLRLILSEKLFSSEFKGDAVADSIVIDLRNRNKKFHTPYSLSGTRKNSLTGEFIKDIIDSKYISVFTAREITFEYEIQQRKISFIDLLLENLIETFKNNKPLKFYRFNFPLEQTCELFWRGLRKEIIKYLKLNKDNFFSILGTLKQSGILKIETNVKNELHNNNLNEETVSSDILTYLSKNGIINVFHLESPIYTTPCVAINPNEINKASIYLFLQSSPGVEQLHQLTNEELLLWKLFVWDTLKKNKAGKSVHYSSNF